MRRLFTVNFPQSGFPMKQIGRFIETVQQRVFSTFIRQIVAESAESVNIG